MASCLQHLACVQPQNLQTPTLLLNIIFLVLFFFGAVKLTPPVIFVWYRKNLFHPNSSTAPQSAVPQTAEAQLRAKPANPVAIASAAPARRASEVTQASSIGNDVTGSASGTILDGGLESHVPHLLCKSTLVGPLPSRHFTCQLSKSAGQSARVVRLCPTYRSIPLMTTRTHMCFRSTFWLAA